MTEFVPNGLLVQLPSFDSRFANETTLPETLDDAFVPNGLLSTNLTGKGVLIEQALPLEEQSIEPAILQSLSIPSEGFTPRNDIVTASTSQDELPSLSQIFPSLPRSSRSIPILCPPSYLPAVRATTFSGRPVHFKRKRKPAPAFLNADTVEQLKLGGLLQVPIHRLMDQLSENTAKSLTEAPAAAPNGRTISNKEQDDLLWVDRYRPNKFLDLVGDERVNRESFSWLKEWDWCVFGKRAKRKNRPPMAKPAPNEDYVYQDEYHRPREKILLLSGPPGLGKTTLAHVIARQAGYEVLEINASDARTGQVIDDRVRPALESGAGVKTKKPVLVVIDEVDGATGDNATGFIHNLISLTLEKPKKKTNKGKAKRPLLRPIICICNDLYSSSLARLRAVARVIRVQPPAAIHLVKRLRDICEVEGMRADSRALSTLVGISQGDMRGCLNTLQLIKCRNQEVTETVVRAATVGMKESETTLHSVLEDIFEPMSKKKVKDQGLSELEEFKYVARLSWQIDALGAFDKVAVGCFEHYTRLRLHDASFTAYESASEWLIYYDGLSSLMRSEQEYAVLPYLSYTLLPFYALFASKGGCKVERPTADWENHTRTKTNEEIYKSMGKCLQADGGRSTEHRHLVSNQILQLEFAPIINRIISPPLRPVNSQIIKPIERALLARLVDIMVSLDLRFVQDKSEDGSLVYRLEPPIDVFVTYDGKRAVDIPVSRYAVRHMVAQEIDSKFVADKTGTEKRKPARSDFFKNRGHNEYSEMVDADVREVSKKRPHEAIDIADLPPTDFFGRPIVVQGSQTQSGEDAPPQKKYKVAYKFHEGNSAAVRKSVKVGAFLR